MSSIFSLQIQGKAWLVKFQMFPPPSNTFANISDIAIKTKALSTNELKDVFYSLKSNQNPADSGS